MSEGWNDPTDMVGWLRNLEKQVMRLTRGANAPDTGLQELLQSLVTVTDGVVVVYRQDEPPLEGVDGVPDPILENSIWFDTDDGNRHYVRNPGNTDWVQADTRLTNITVQTSPEDNVGIKLADNGLVAYGPDGADVGTLGDVTFFIDAITGAVVTVGPIITGGEITGALVLGGTIVMGNSPTSGERIILRKDGGGGVLEFWSGVAGETVPGVMDPAIFLGTHPAVRIESGETTTATHTGSLFLGTALFEDSSSASLTAGVVSLNAKDSLIYLDNQGVNVDTAGFLDLHSDVAIYIGKSAFGPPGAVDVHVGDQAGTDNVHLHNVVGGSLAPGDFRDDVDARVSAIAPTLTMTTGSVGTGAFANTVAQLQVPATVASTVNASPNSTTNITITGLSRTFTAIAGAKYEVVINANLSITTAGTLNVVELLVDGVADPLSILTSGPAGLRGMFSQTWLLTGLSAGSHTLTARTRNSAASSGATIWSFYTTMTSKRVG